MSNLSDKELDRLSREAADSYEPDASPLSWSRLEQKLTQHMPERPPDAFRIGRINPYIWGPAVAVFAGLSYFFIKNVSNSKVSTPSVQTVNQKSVPGTEKSGQDNANYTDSLSAAAEREGGVNLPAAGSAPEAGNKSPVGKDAASANPATGTGESPDSRKTGTVTGSEISGSNSRNNISGQNSVSNDKKVSSGGRRSKEIAGSAALTAGAINSTGAPTSISGQTSKGEKAGSTDQDDNASAYAAISARSKNQISLPSVVTGSAGLGTVSGNDSLMNLQAKSTTPVRNKTLRLNRSLNFGLSFGPDYTDGGGITNNQIGNNIGLTVGYYLTNRLSVNTGFFYSNKFYWAQGKGYRHPAPPVNPYATTFAAPPPVEYVNGSCNMWELPITLRYDFARNDKTRFFVDGGLSSYFMMKQTLVYFTHTSQRQLAAWKTSDNQQVNYWFSVADISVGFETEVGKGVSFQAEPFIKLPLKNMGVENLKLNSYGFLLSFKFTPVLSKTRK